MKTAVILVALFGFVCGDQMQYTNGGDPVCERLNVDAVFTTTATKGQTEVDSQTFTTNSDSFSQGSCSNTSSTLAITFNGTEAKWTLIFTAKEEEKVNVTMMLQYKADQMFPGKNLTGRVFASQIGKLTLSPSDKSYVCVSEETIQFQPVNASDIVYTVSLKMTSLQVQAFNLPKEKFSEATVCDKDEASTSEGSTAPTTAAEDTTTDAQTTTEEPTTTTEPSTASEETTTTTAAATTTTMAPKPTRNTYTVKEDNETCIIMSAAISLMVSYPTADNKTATANINVPQTASATGSCGNGSESNGTVTVKFDNNTIDFVFLDKENKAEIGPVTLRIVQDPTNFPNAKNPNAVMQLDSSDTQALSDDTTYYLCNTGNMIKLNGDSNLDLTQFQVQAFNLKNDNFTGTGDECAADKSSTAASTTTMAPTTPKPSPSNPPVNKFSVSEGNTTCLLMNASLVLDITYTMKNGTTSVASLFVPSLTSSSHNGTCGNVTETLNIMFFDDWVISFVFTDTDGVSEDDGLGAAVQNYALANVSVTYQYDQRLPDANMTGSSTGQATNLNKFKATTDGSYKCSADTDISTDNDVKMVLSNFQYQAFQTGNKEEFNTGNLQECEADTETNSIVPIAVGAALAGLVVIVLIAYLIGRRKSRRAGYESV